MKKKMPAIVLVTPQMGENIGMSARAMGNFDFTDLRIVSPRDGWPNDKAIRAAVGSPVLGNVSLFKTLPEALHDQRYVYGTSVRQRHMQKAVMSPSMFVQEALSYQEVAVVFGGESSGLSNEDLSHCSATIEIETSEKLPSINLAQAVFAICYTWCGHVSSDETKKSTIDPPAAKRDLEHFFNHLEDSLDKNGFFYPVAKKKTMIRNIRHSLQRANFTDQEVRTWRGIVDALARTTRQDRARQNTYPAAANQSTRGQEEPANDPS